MIRACLVLATALIQVGEIIDRIVAAVDGRIITQSDIRLERVLMQRTGEKIPEEDGPILEHLIDLLLLEEQARADTHLTVSPEQEDAEMQGITDLKGFSRDTIRAAVHRQLIIDQHIGERFGAFAGVQETDARRYYEDVFLPEMRNRNVSPIPPFDQVREAITRNVMAEQVAAELKRWLDDRRRTATIEYVGRVKP